MGASTKYHFERGARSRSATYQRDAKESDRNDHRITCSTSPCDSCSSAGIHPAYVMSGNHRGPHRVGAHDVCLNSFSVPVTATRNFRINRVFVRATLPSKWRATISLHRLLACRSVSPAQTSLRRMPVSWSDAVRECHRGAIPDRLG